MRRTVRISGSRDGKSVTVQVWCTSNSSSTAPARSGRVLARCASQALRLSPDRSNALSRRGAICVHCERVKGNMVSGPDFTSGSGGVQPVLDPKVELYALWNRLPESPAVDRQKYRMQCPHRCKPETQTVGQEGNIA